MTISVEDVFEELYEERAAAERRIDLAKAAGVLLEVALRNHNSVTTAWKTQCRELVAEIRKEAKR